MAKKKQRMWIASPSKQSKGSVPDDVKVEVERKAKDFIETVLKPIHVKPPPENPTYNYVIDLSTKWHGGYFYFTSTYACPGPNALSPTFQSNFARLQPVGAGKFHLAYIQHTEQWVELFTGQTLEECFKSIQEDPWFMP